MNKIIKIALVVIGLIGAVLWFMLPTRDMSEADPAMAAQSGPMNAMFWITYILVGIAVILSLGFALVNLFSSPASLKKTLFVVVGFLIAAGIAYALADGTDVDIEEMSRKGIETSEATVKKIGMGINMFLILIVVAVGAMLFGGVKNLTSK